MSYLPAEWHKQSLIQLTWPHKDTPMGMHVGRSEYLFS